MILNTLQNIPYKKAIASILLFFISVALIKGQETADLSYKQLFILPNNFKSGDICGTYYIYADYDPVSTIQFEITGGNPGNIFSIQSQTGNISLNASQPITASVINLLIKISDGSLSEIDTAVIQVIDSSKCIFVDPSYAYTGDGTRNNPYKSWNSVSFTPGYCYLQKRGTVYSTDEISIPGPGGSAQNRIVLGAYGSGARPVLNGSNLPDIKGAIWFGSTQSITGYIDIYSFVAHSSRGIEGERGTHHVRLFDCEVYNCHDNGGIYFKELSSDIYQSLYNEMYNCSSHDNYNTHGIKTAPGTYIMNCKVYNNKLANGITAPSHSRINHTVAYQNNQYGIEADGNDIIIENSKTYANYIGIYYNYSNNGIVRNCTSLYNSYGITIDYYTTDILIEKCEVHYNIMGIEIAGGAENVEVSRNHASHNTAYGITVQEHVDAPGYSQNIHFTYNLADYNENSGLSISYVDDVYVHNNTIIGNSLSIENTAYSAQVYNNIATAVSGSYSGSNNLINPSNNIFIDANSGDYHLKPTETSAIDKGIYLGLRSDIEGNMVPNGENPDIGAYEYQGVLYDALPEAPTDISGYAEGPTSIALNWIDHSDIEFGFDLERSKGSSTSFALVKSLNKNILSYTDKNLEPSTQYNYRVRAYNNKGYSGYSNEVSIRTSDPPIPEAPKNLGLISITKNQAVIAWTDNSDVESGFTIYYKTTSSSTYSQIHLLPNVTHYAIPGLIPATSYQAKVCAFNSTGQSDFSNEISFTTTTLQIPPAPSNLTVSEITNTYINLLWVDNSQNETGFELYRSLNATTGFTLIKSIAKNITYYADNSITSGQTYYFKIRSYNQDGYSAFSDVKQVVAVPFNTPDAPSNLTVVQTSYDFISLSWSDRSDDETGFRLQRTGPNSSNTFYYNLSANTTSFIDTGLVSNAKYTYAICAVNSYGFSVYSNTVSLYTLRLDPPLAPTIFKVTGATDKTISLEWADNSSNEKNFIITRTLVSNPDSVVVFKITSNETKYIDHPLSSSTAYTYRIYAQNKAGNSSSSTIEAYTFSESEALRTTDGLVAYYNFIKNTGNIVKDLSYYESPLNLRIMDVKAVEWIKDRKLSILGNTSLISMTSATKVIRACKQTQEITVECWVKPSETGSQHISNLITVDESNNNRVFAMTQNLLKSENSTQYSYETALRTESTNTEGLPLLDLDNNISYINLNHIVYCRDSLGYERIYINGQIRAEGFRPSGFDAWKETSLFRLGNNYNNTLPWRGTYYLVAIYNKALSFKEVSQNHHAGPSDSLVSAGFIYDIYSYPNPSTDNITLKIIPTESADIYNEMIVRILNSNGVLLKEEKIFNPTQVNIKTYDIGSFLRGMYYIQVISGNSSKSIKFVKL